MAMLTIPSSPDEVTAEWLTQALRSTGSIVRARVGSFSREDLGMGRGFVGQVSRFRLAYEVDEDGAPASLVGKFSSPNPDLRAAMFGANETELRFYHEIAPHVDLTTPRLFYGAANPETSQSVLLLEDISSDWGGDDVAGCSPGQERIAMRQLARFHASWWDSPRVDQFTWLPSINHNGSLLQEGYQQAWRIFVGKFGDYLPPSLREVAARFVDNVAHIKDQLATRPTTILHGDYRLDNLFFGPPDSGHPLIVIDWQGAHKGTGASDIAYFQAFCLEPEHRRAVEMDLIRDYHESLVDNGVIGYDFDQCLQDYRLSMFEPLGVLVMAGAYLDFASERGRALAAAGIQRLTAAMADHRMVELLADF